MNIAIEALGIHYFGGGRSATLKLLETLFSTDSENEYLVFLSQPEPTLDATNVRQVVAPFKNRFALRLWAQIVVPRTTRTYDLVHFTKNLGVFGVAVPTIVTMYDMTTLVYPDRFPRFDVWYWRNVQERTLRAAKQIIAISQNTARDIASYYQIPSDCIEVIYPAHADHFVPVLVPEMEAIRRRYNLPQRYVLNVGRIDRVKNLSSLVCSFAQLKRTIDYQGKLVIAGEEYPKSSDTNIYSLVKDLDLLNDVVFTGPVPDQHLPAIFSAAEVTVMPSLNEGFGIVALEAMASGSPLIVNRAGALAETVGDAAIVLNTDDEQLLFRAIALVVSQIHLQQAMKLRGLARAKKFDWNHSARQTLDIYRKVAMR